MRRTAGKGSKRGTNRFKAPAIQIAERHPVNPPPMDETLPCATADKKEEAAPHARW